MPAASAAIVFFKYAYIITAICESDVTRDGRNYEKSKIKINRFSVRCPNVILRLQYASGSFLRLSSFLFWIHTFQKAMQWRHPSPLPTWERMRCISLRPRSVKMTRAPDRRIRKTSPCFHPNGKNTAFHDGLLRRVLFSARPRGLIFYRS